MRAVPLLIADAHNAAGAAAAGLAIGCAGVLLRDRVVSLDIATSQPARTVPAIELLGVLLACVLPALATPQLQSWEVLHRRRRLAVVKSLIGFVLATLPAVAVASIVWVSQPAWSVSSPLLNVWSAGGTAVILTVLLGPRVGPPTALTLYLGLILVEEFCNGMPFLPIALSDEHPGLVPRLYGPVVSVGAAIAWWYSFGSVRLARMLGD